jgi:transaldolase
MPGQLLYPLVTRRATTEWEYELNATEQLRAIGQSLWLDNITRALLRSGTLRSYIDGLSITGLTSNPTIFEKAISHSNDYDMAIRRKAGSGFAAEDLFFELALDDLTQAADLFLPTFEATGGVDGWVSLEVSPLLANDPEGSVTSAVQLHARALRPNLFIKLPGTTAGIAAIEESIFRGIPVNVTLLFSRAQYLAAADAYLRGIERRVAAGLSPRVASVASIFVSRWDAAANDSLPAHLRNHLGLAVARQIHGAYRDLLASARWQKLSAAGAMIQRLLWASTGSKDPAASDTFYIDALAAPDTINTIPEPTLLAFAAHGNVGSTLPTDGGDCEQLLAAIKFEGVKVDELASALQQAGVTAFCKSWSDILAGLASKSGVPASAHPTGRG